MVGFFCESTKEEEEGVVGQLKSKTLDEPERLSFDSEVQFTELDSLSLASLEPFVDFDFIKDWIEETPSPDNPISCRAQGMDATDNSQSAEVECDGRNELAVENSGGIVDTVKSNGLEKSSVSDFVKADVGSAENKCLNYQSEPISLDKFEDVSGVAILDAELESLNCSIEEDLEKVSLAGGKGDLVTDVNEMKEMDSKVISEESESESESDSESESESESETSSSASSSESDDEPKKTAKEIEMGKSKINFDDKEVDVEDGEIMDSDGEKMVSWTDNDIKDDDDEEDIATEILNDLDIGDHDEDTGLPKGPIRSKNELKELPPVPPITASLEPHHQVLPIGVILSVLGTQVIVEGSVKHNPISEGSILWITERRLPLGIIDEIFGPVKTPFYIVRYNSESEVPSDIENGTTIGFVSDFAGHVLNDKSVYQKGYDASGENDEEVFDEAEFSDDEKEAEYRRMLKMSKRDNNNDGQGSVTKKKNRKNSKNRENTWTKNQPSPQQPNSSPCFSQGNQSVFAGGGPSGPPPTGPVFPGGPNTFTRMPQPNPGPFNGNWANGMRPQPQNMAMPSGFQPNGGFQLNGMQWGPQNYQQSPIPWQNQQQVPQFPLGMPGQSQPQFDLSQLLTGFNGSALGPMNFNMGTQNGPWLGMLGQNLRGQAPYMGGMQNPNVFPGFTPNGPQIGGASSNSGPVNSFSGNEEVSSQSHQCASSGRGRGRGRNSFQHRGGRFGGRRGRG